MGAKKKSAEGEKHAAPVSRTIKSTRLQKSLSLERIANETGFSVRYLKDVEEGLVAPPVGALLQIARALQIDSGSLLKEQAPAQRAKAGASAKRTESYAYEMLTPDAESKHLKAFYVIVEPGQEHRGGGYQHEGEEFGYVLKGRVKIVVGDHINILKSGDSVHFNSGIRHQLLNAGRETAELLVVIYSP